MGGFSAREAVRAVRRLVCAPAFTIAAVRPSPLAIVWALSMTVPSRAHSETRDWTVVARPFRADGAGEERFYWIGLRNATDSARAFCTLGVSYEYDLPDGATVMQSTVEYPSVGSPHRCDPSIGHLVLPGQTHFVKVSISPAARADGRRGVRFSITGEQACVDSRPCARAFIQAAEAPEGAAERQDAR
ncbi:MAG: hypothetical protein ABW221_23860 [Vicinamibacteria bacterium]